MTKLSVNINKFATLRNARGGNNPDVVKAAVDCETYGAQGITVHPRPDQRHIRASDVNALANLVKPVKGVEYNIEGNPIPKFIDLVLEIKPTQVTLVPDSEDAITSNAGWNTVKHQKYLKKIIDQFKANGIRTSIFVDPEITMVQGALETGTDRIELYTESYAKNYHIDKSSAILPYVDAAKKANELGIGVNAGHDLNLNNLAYFSQNIPDLLEVSIGHALICESLYLGFENVIPMYLQRLSN